MNYSTKELKKLARMQLSGKYGTFILAQILINLIVSAVSIFLGENIILSLLITIISSLISSVLMFGLTYMSIRISRNQPIAPSDIFYGFKHHPDRIIILQLILTGLTFLCMGPGYVVLIYGIINLISTDLYNPNSVGNTLPFIIGILLLLVGLILILLLTFMYSQAMYLMADYDNFSAINALKESRHLMKGKKRYLLYLNLSFIGMVFLGILSLGIGMLWIQPYIIVTQAYFYRDLIQDLPNGKNVSSSSYSEMSEDSTDYRYVNEQGTFRTSDSDRFDY